MGQDRPCEQDPHVIRRGKKFPESSDVGLEPLWVRVDVFFQLGNAQGLPDVAVRNIGSSQDDIILDRALKQCELGVDHEPSTTIDCLKIEPCCVPVSPTGTSIDNRAIGTHTSPRIVYGE